MGIGNRGLVQERVRGVPGTPLPSLVPSSPPSATRRQLVIHVITFGQLAIPHVCQRAPCLFARAHTFYATPRAAHNLLGRRRHSGTLCPNARVHPVFLVVTPPTPVSPSFSVSSSASSAMHHYRHRPHNGVEKIPSVRAARWG